MEQRDVVGRIVRDDAVVVVRIARRGIERLVAALRAADEIERSGARPYAFLMISIATSCPFFTDSLPKFRSASSSIANRAVESGRGLWPPSVPSVTNPCLSGVVHVRRLQREGAEAGDQRAVVAAAAHLQHAAVPRLRQVDLELQIRRARVLRLDDADALQKSPLTLPCSDAATATAVWTTAPPVGRPIADAGIDRFSRLAHRFRGPRGVRSCWARPGTARVTSANVTSRRAVGGKMGGLIVIP